MTEKRLCLAVICVALVVAPARAQDPPHNEAVRVEQLWRIFSDLYGPEGLVVDSTASLAGGQSHPATSPAASRASSRSSASRSPASWCRCRSRRRPPASPTSSTRPSGCSPARPTTSARSCPSAPRPSARAGCRTGFATQRLEFDLIEGLDLSHIPAVFSHDNAELLGGREDVITTMNSVEAASRARRCS